MEKMQIHTPNVEIHKIKPYNKVLGAAQLMAQQDEDVEFNGPLALAQLGGLLWLQLSAR